jgi:hypothetical protein
MRNAQQGHAMTPGHRTLVERELRAIKRTVARIEASFEGVPRLLARLLLAAERKTVRRVRQTVSGS